MLSNFKVLTIFKLHEILRTNQIRGSLSRSLIGLKSWPFQPGRGQPSWRARAGVFDSARVSSILSFTWNLRVASVTRNLVKSLCFKQSSPQSI